jgi:hypothetical protein
VRATLRTAPRRLLDWLRKEPLLAGLFFALLAYYAATPGIFEGKASGDGLMGFHYLRGLFLHGTLDLGVTGPHYASIYGRQPNGRVANPCPFGPTLLWWPTYLLGLLLKKVSGQRLDGAPTFDYFMTGLSTVALGCAGLVLTVRLLRRWASEAAARFALLGMALGTPLCWYLVHQPLYQHGTSFFTVALFVERWDAWRRDEDFGTGRPARWAALGALGGLMMMVRLQEGIFLLLPGLDALVALVQARRRPDALRRGLRVLCCGVLFLLGAAVAFAPQALVWKYFYGRFHPPQPPGHMRWTSPAVVEALFSIRGGILPWTPLYYVALPGLVLGWRALGGVAGRLVLLFCLEFYINASVWDYHASWGYGARRFVGSSLIFAAGLCGAYARVEVLGWQVLRRWGRRALAGVLALLCAYNLLLTELVRQRRIKSSAAGAFPTATWARWARAPGFVVRYLARYGYPFVQPAAWIYGLIYRMPTTSFEGIVGNYLLERDWHVRTFIMNPGFAFRDLDHWRYPVSGLPAPPEPAGNWPPGTLVPVLGSEMRLVIPLSAREPLRFALRGAFPGASAPGQKAGQDQKIEVRWNGAVLPAEVSAAVISAEVPERLTHSRGWLNEVEFRGLPAGSKVLRMDFTSLGRWWR